MAENLLQNGGFEADWSEEKSHWVLVFPVGADPYFKELGNIFTPPGWLTWFRHEAGTWDQPEVTDTHTSVYPERVCEGERAIKLFTFQRRHDAGLMQQVAVEPGVWLRLTARAHAWSNHDDIEGYEWCANDGLCSAGVGREAYFCLEGEAPELCGDPWSDAIQNFTFYLGVDPTGGTNPFADTVVWGLGAHIYNEYASVPEVEVVTAAEKVTVFLRSQTMFAFRHNDAYWDDIKLETAITHGSRYSPEKPRAGQVMTVEGLSCEQVKTHLVLRHESGNLVEVEFQDEYYFTAGWFRYVRVWTSEPVLWRGRYTMEFYLGSECVHDADFHVPDGVPAPEPEPPPPVGGTKLGAHNLQGGSLAFLEVGGAASLATEGWGDTFLAPDNILKMGAVPTVGYDAQCMYYDMQLSPPDAAAKFIADCRDTMEWNAWCPYWLGHNEPVWEIEGQPNHDGMAWYAQFEIERMKQLDALAITARNGERFGPGYYRAVVGNFSCGCPPFDLWPSFYPALAVLREYEGLLGLHEYSWGWMWWLTGSYQPDDGWGALPEDHGWLTCRWKMLRDVFLEPEGLGDVPIVITECGLDGGISPKPPQYADVGGAWKSLVDKWETREGVPDGQRYYAEQLAWYDAQLRADPYVVGATIFTFGAHGGGPWERFDLGGTEALEHLTAYTAQNPTTGFVYPLPSEPQLLPPLGGLPRVQYERTYVLLPPDAGAAWAKAIIDARWDSDRWTIGGSADDAGLGVLDSKRVLAINPHLWTPALTQAWFDEHYPGAVFEAVVADTPEQLKLVLGLPNVHE